MLRGGELKEVEEEDAVFDLRHFTSCLGPLERFQSSLLLDHRCKMRRLFIYFYFELLWFAFTPIHLLWSECISDLRSDEIGQTRSVRRGRDRSNNVDPELFLVRSQRPRRWAPETCTWRGADNALTAGHFTMERQVRGLILALVIGYYGWLMLLLLLWQGKCLLFCEAQSCLREAL